MGRIKDEELFLLIKNFLTIYLPVQRKASNNTVNNYRIVLNQFIKYVSELKKVPYTAVTSAMIGKETVNGYLDSLLNEKNISSATRNNRLAALKSFLNYAAALKPEYISIMSEVSSIKAQRIPLFSKVDYMTEEAITALLNETDTSTEIGVRDQFFMILLYDTGGRIQEIIDIRISDIKIGKTPSVLLHGKGNKDRVVPLMDNTVAHLNKYMHIFHPHESWASNEFLFYTKQKSRQNKICDDTIRARMKIYAASAHRKCAEVPENLHPHLWRHSRAMHLYQHGMDLTLISQWLGHKNYTTTLIYAYADTEAKRIAIEKAMTNGIDPVTVTEKTYAATDEETIKKLYGLK